MEPMASTSKIDDSRSHKTNSIPRTNSSIGLRDNQFKTLLSKNIKLPIDCRNLKSNNRANDFLISSVGFYDNDKRLQKIKRNKEMNECRSQNIINIEVKTALNDFKTKSSNVTKQNNKFLSDDVIKEPDPDYNHIIRQTSLNKMYPKENENFENNGE